MKCGNRRAHNGVTGTHETIAGVKACYEVTYTTDAATIPERTQVENRNHLKEAYYANLAAKSAPAGNRIDEIERFGASAVAEVTTTAIDKHPLAPEFSGGESDTEWMRNKGYTW